MTVLNIGRDGASRPRAVVMTYSACPRDDDLCHYDRS